METPTTKLQFQHDFSPEKGHEIELTIRCRLGAAPTLLRQVIASSIDPLVRQYDPDWRPARYQPPSSSSANETDTQTSAE